MKAGFSALNEQESSRSARVSTWIPEPATLASHSEDYSNASAPTYWHSPQGKKAMGSLQAVAPPLDLRKLDCQLRCHCSGINIVWLSRIKNEVN